MFHDIINIIEEAGVLLDSGVFVPVCFCNFGSDEVDDSILKHILYFPDSGVVFSVNFLDLHWSGLVVTEIHEFAKVCI